MAKKIKNSEQLEISSVPKEQIPHYTAYRSFLSKYGTYKDMQKQYERLQIGEDFIQALIDELDEFFSNPDINTQPLQFDDFLAVKKIRRNMWWRWCQTYPQLDEMHQYIKVLLSSRRETGMLRHGLPASPIMRVQRHYSDVWEDIAQQEKKDKQEEASGGNRPYDVTLEALPDDPHSSPDKTE